MTGLAYAAGWISCFVALLTIGWIRRLTRRRSVLQMRPDSGVNEKVRFGERIVAVLNAGTPQERVIDTRSN